MTDRPKPFLSVIISTKNARQHLQECLDSIFFQTDSRWEVIVIDAASDDGTQEIIERNAARLKYWLSEPDSGVYDAWNKALKHVTGCWVMFLGADDGLRNNRVLASLVSALSDIPNKIAYGRVALTDEMGRLIREEGVAWPKIASRFRNEMCIPHQGVLHRADMFRERRFDTSFRYAGDYFFLLEEVFSTPPLFIDMCVSTWRQGGLTSSAGQSFKVLREFRKARNKADVGGIAPIWTECKAIGKLALEKLFGRNLSACILDIYRNMRRSQ